MRNHDFDRAMWAIARRQHGAIHLRQAREAGGSKDMVRARIRSGMFIPLTHRVLAVAGHPATWQRQFKAAELSVPGSALADRSAGVVHGFAGFRVGRPALVAPPNANGRSTLADVRRSASIEAVVVDGIRVTSLRRTLFDLLACSPLQVVERALDDLLVSRRLTVDHLAELERDSAASRRPNVATWRMLVEERSADGWQPTESELEVELSRVLGGLPDDVVVRRQATPAWWAPASNRVDAYLPDWNLIVEADGRRWHTRVADFDRDRWRDNLAVARGHRVLRFTHTHLTRQPDDARRLVIEAGRHPTSLGETHESGSAA